MMTMARTWDYEIQLAELVKGVNENGYPYERLEYKDKLLANKLSVSSTEHWAAKQSAIHLEHVFEIHEIEYNGEQALRFNNRDYKIEHTYLNKDGFLELKASLWGDDHAT